MRSVLDQTDDTQALGLLAFIHSVIIGTQTIDRRVSGDGFPSSFTTVATESKRNIRDIELRPLSPHFGASAEVRDVVKVPEAFLVPAAEDARLPRRSERGHFSGELLVKVTDVFLAADGRDEGRGHFPLQQRLPVHVLAWRGETQGWLTADATSKNNWC